MAFETLRRHDPSRAPRQRPRAHRAPREQDPRGRSRQYDFKGGLVPGVTMYAWITHPWSKRWAAWLEGGTFETGFAQPIYYEEPAVIRAVVAAKTDESVRIDGRRPQFSRRGLGGTATMWLERGRDRRRRGHRVRRGRLCPPKAAGDPRTSRASRSGTPELDLPPGRRRHHALRGETLAVYRGAAHRPTRVSTSISNRVLDRNVTKPDRRGEPRRHWSAARVGDRLADARADREAVRKEGRRTSSRPTSC